MMQPSALDFVLGIATIITGGKPILVPTYNGTLHTSPAFYPSPWMKGETVGWKDAFSQAKDFVSQLTLLEKVNLTTGVGYVSDKKIEDRIFVNLIHTDGWASK